jgi:palmitoyltransferase
LELILLQHWAAIKGNIQVADILLEKGANIDKADKSGYNAVHLTCQNGHFLMLHYLNCKGADLRTVDHELHTPLHWAAYQGHVEVAIYLLNHVRCIVSPTNQ